MKLASHLTAVLLLGLGLAVVGCKSTHESDVKSDLRTQWASVNADTKTTTDAAKAVLAGDEFNLKNVDSSSTSVDGKASAKMADGTVVRVAVTKEANGSDVSVTVGTVGNPSLGAEIAKKIKMKAEGMAGH